MGDRGAAKMALLGRRDDDRIMPTLLAENLSTEAVEREKRFDIVRADPVFGVANDREEVIAGERLPSRH